MQNYLPRSKQHFTGLKAATRQADIWSQLVEAIADANTRAEGNSGTIGDATAGAGEEADARTVMPAVETLSTAALAQAASIASPQPAAAQVQSLPTSLTCFLAVTDA